MFNPRPSEAIALASEDLLAACQIVEEACGRPDPRDHRGWAEAAEACGLHGLAFREWLLAARAAPQDTAVLLRLAELYRERGDGRRATALLERSVALPSPPAEAWTALAGLYAEDRLWDRIRDLVVRARSAGVEDQHVRAMEALLPRPARALQLEFEEAPQAPDPQTPLLSASDADLVRFLSLFGGREEVHARQWFDPRKGQGGYSPVEQPLTVRELRAHLAGDVTLGVYTIRLDGTVGFFVLDLDITRRALDEARSSADRARDLRQAAAAFGLECVHRLAALGFDPLLESSGYKGRHVWVFLDPPQRADKVHRLGELLLSQLDPALPPGLHLEFFPKQKRRGGAKGLGNLVKLPLGVHRVSGRRSLLLDREGKPVAEPFELLRSVRRAGADPLDSALETLRAATVEPAGPQAPEPPEPADGIAASSLPVLPPSAPAPPAWTAADFESHADMAHLMGRCPVLDKLRGQAEQERRLSYDEQMVLVHTLGHLPHGLLAANYLLARVPEVPAERFLKKPLAGNPMSCPKIRHRIPHVTSQVACNCVFPLAPEHYPTPELHLLELPASATASNVPVAAPEPPALEALARSFRILRRRLAEMEQELSSVTQALAAQLKRLPDAGLDLEGGRLVLRQQEGVESVEWEPNAECGMRNAE